MEIWKSIGSYCSYSIALLIKYRAKLQKEWENTNAIQCISGNFDLIQGVRLFLELGRKIQIIPHYESH